MWTTTKLIYWIRNYLSNQRSKTKLCKGIGPKFEVRTSTPQGSPLSPILYLFFNADLLKIGIGGALITVYVHSIAIMIEGGNTASNNSVLTTIYQTAARYAARSAQLHASVFAPQKYELKHFIHCQDAKDSRTKC
jgi:hypothetical protein